jgi:uncharacterized protein (TIGR02231 family)
MRIRNFLAAILSAAAFPACAAEITATSSIEEVTVFPAGAEIARTIAVKLDAGDHSVAADVTAQAIPASVRVEGAASGGLQIGSVDVQTVYIPSTDPAVAQSERKKIEDEIEKLRDRRAAEDDIIEGAKLQQAYLQNLVTLPQSQGIREQVPNRDWGELVGVLGPRMTEAAKTIAEAKLRQRGLDRAIADLEKSLPPAGGSTESRTRVKINVTAGAPLEAKLILRYQVNGANWQPFYDARLATGDGANAPKLTLTRRGAITQSTGEDWDDVKLSLSTTRPGTATAAPNPNMLSVDFEPQSPPAAAPAAPPAPQGAQIDEALKRPLGGKTIYDRLTTGDAAVVASERYAQAAVSAFQAVYKIGGKTTVKTTGETKRLQIVSEGTDTSIFVRAVPRLDHTAYLYARLALAGTSSPLLPGQVSLFRDGVYVGTGSLPQLSPGETCEFGFGADERVKVKQVVAADKTGETGTFSKSRVEEHGYTVTVKNLHARSVDIEVIDRMPVSVQEEIKVDFSVTTGPQPAAVEGENKRGIIRWTLKTEPGEEKKLAYSYRVTAPADKKIRYTGLSAEQMDQWQVLRFGAATKF